VATAVAAALLAGGFPGVPAAAATPGAVALTATILPATGGQDGSQLAVNWPGASGARLTVALREPARAESVLVHGRALRAGANLVPLPVDADDAGALRLTVGAPSGATATRVTDLAGLRGTSRFAWQPGSAAAVPAGLYVGGTFTEAGGVPVNRVTRWSGSAWSALAGPGGTGTDSQVSVLRVFNGELIAGGGFMYAGGNLVRGIARWNGTDWLPLTGPSGTGVMTRSLDFVASLAVFNGSLIVGGQFLRAGGKDVNHIARWTGTDWFPLTGPSGTGVNAAAVWALTSYNGALAVGGGFTEAGGVPANRVARWNGTAWSALGTGVGTGELTADTMALAVYNGALVAGGYFTVAGTTTVNNIARWNGSTWSALAGPSGTGTSDPVRALAVYGNALYVGGHFLQAGGVTVNHIARWNGSAWSALTGPSGTGTNAPVYALAVYAGTLLAGGGFTDAGGLAVTYLARWNGSTWSALTGTGPNDYVFALLTV
jgi:hypothetical protein